MANTHQDAGPLGESGENRRTPEEKRDIGQPSVGQAQREHLPPNNSDADDWPHATMPGDRRHDPDAEKPDASPPQGPKNDSGTVQRGGRDGERGQDDSIKSGDGIAG